ncbi:tRNA epoxyqueuosine(34) reductase QueG [Owenweeksia hongkongensis]|uniref:tRNA epoxyqueuosine(34) reductase QueG n=1 Tax=Owenweeksia hongkongensis TaxID=253245 RepID=UPI003A8F4773
MIKAEAKRLGFLDCGISKATFLEEEAPRLEEWLKRGYHGEMKWMENHFDKRLDPRKLVDGAKSVVSVVLNYYPEETQKHPDAPKIAKYAYGEDYHFVIKRKLKELTEFIQTEIGEVNGRAFTDSAPVMDRAWAERSGLGWTGKHSLLLSKGTGSFYLIGELILDLDIEEDTPVTDHCGSCTKCIDACPTDAIVAPKLVDGSKCISYLTIELKDQISPSFKDQMEGWAFGCDICQDVCPWNRFSKPTKVEEFSPHPEMLDMNKQDWQEITEDVFRKVFKKSAVKRAKYAGLKQNIDFLKPTY